MTMHIKQELKKIYNEHARERNASSKQDWKIQSRARFLEQLKVNHTRTLLDIGAGTGQDSLYFMDHGLDVTAIDLSEEHVSYCLLHVPKADLNAVLMELKRVLAPNGLFYLGVYGGYEFEGINERDNFIEKRFFSFHRFEAYQKLLLEHFEVIEGERIVIEKEFEHHSFLLRKKMD
ncbi:class I SAM-dependent methyltransferase [Paenibacillus apiarius]|nr:class I SAM-dependent methyltransferase [Paenibacillus apiarius]